MRAEFLYKQLDHLRELRRLANRAVLEEGRNQKDNRAREAKRECEKAGMKRKAERVRRSSEQRLEGWPSRKV